MNKITILIFGILILIDLYVCWKVLYRYIYKDKIIDNENQEIIKENELLRIENTKLKNKIRKMRTKNDSKNK